MIRAIWMTLAGALVAVSINAMAASLEKEVNQDYEAYLKPLFVHFHSNPELSMGEHNTAARMANELQAVGFEVHTGIAETGVVGMLRNGPGPLVMFRADMDGLPMLERSGLEYASTARQVDPITGIDQPVMHACGHDMHITSMVGTARYMASHRDEWSGTLMLVVQPAEERLMGARLMRQDDLWERFGKPDYAFGLHVASIGEAGTVSMIPGPVMAGANSVDIIIHGIGTHGAYPHAGKDPVVIGSQIVLALQTLVSRELAPRDDAVVTVGAFNAGSKHNIIPDRAHLQLTVRSDSAESRDKLLNGIRRIATNIGRAAGLPEDKLPEVLVSADEVTAPVINDAQLVQTVRNVWAAGLGEEAVRVYENNGMGAEDYSEFIVDPEIPSVYWQVGGTPAREIELAEAGGAPVPAHHSPLFKIDPDAAVPRGVESTVLALKAVMPSR